MIENIYNLFLDDKLLGTSKLEFGDPPMGIVFGQINFVEASVGYNFIKQYCIDNLIEIRTDYPNEKIIATGKIENLKVCNSANCEIVGIGNSIEGMDTDIYTITILGLDEEIYRKEFPIHIAEYEHKFNS